ncbi:hypothetical protein [Vibrio rotiferianus]|uniref:hypothetical protein n=1 Tax=Vibrio rotiferianus TaxID=190895 RepID=UPI0003A88003|nr:hypothetical protein [Vibrio rotiferianus]PIB14783.1 hypothetical protein B853_15655 [Vibrio rotiferianus CAIM 577 = LMG 21460]
MREYIPSEETKKYLTEDDLIYLAKYRDELERESEIKIKEFEKMLKPLPPELYEKILFLNRRYKKV